MASAEILTIGTELLLGEIVDTNSRYIAQKLKNEGVDLYWTSTVGDNVERIAQALKLGLSRSDIIITTGGLGPTIDDPTREAVSLAINVKPEYREELWQQVQERFRRYGSTPTENNKKQAYVPQGAIAIENPVGTAPSFIVENNGKVIISLPGVPGEMEKILSDAVMPYLRKKFNLDQIILARILHTAGIGESKLDSIIGDLEVGSNPTVGLSAHAGSVDIRITAKAKNTQKANELIQPLESELRNRLGNAIFGADGDKLEDIAIKNLTNLGWDFIVIEAGFGGKLIEKFTNSESSFLMGEILPKSPNEKDLMALCKNLKLEKNADVCIGISLHKGKSTQNVHFIVLAPNEEEAFSRGYGGPPQSVISWGVTNCLNLLRNLSTHKN
jgi:nicotinamide-nucleotide amidase